MVKKAVFTQQVVYTKCNNCNECTSRDEPSLRNARAELLELRASLYEQSLLLIINRFNNLMVYFTHS